MTPIAVCYTSPVRPKEQGKPKHRSKRAGGAPQKVPGGLDRALYVRVNDTVSAELERLTAAKSKAAGVTLSKADVARGLIQTAMGAHLNDEGRREKLEAMSMTDRIEESGSQSLMKEHLTDYFAADDARRAEVSRRLEDATRRCTAGPCPPKRSCLLRAWVAGRGLQRSRYRSRSCHSLRTWSCECRARPPIVTRSPAHRPRCATFPCIGK